MLCLTIAGTSFLVFLVTSARTATAIPVAVDRDVQAQAMVLPPVVVTSRMWEVSIDTT
jgi:hypothetical protein